ncbi:MAG: hypothetical protein ACKPKO_12350, partial [Candidatus Fonsibacter sp.]
NISSTSGDIQTLTRTVSGRSASFQSLAVGGTVSLNSTTPTTPGVFWGCFQQQQAGLRSAPTSVSILTSLYRAITIKAE